MNGETCSAATVVVGERRSEAAPQVEAYLAERGWSDARRFGRRDVDDVDREACAGRIRRVVFERTHDLLDAIWSEDISYGKWLDVGVAVHLVDATVSGEDVALAALWRSWTAWRRRRQRRQVVAGAVLSVIAIVAVFLLIWSVS
jgi:hypothetical protein